jgi:SAM-dependent methyltransferase
MQDKKYLTIVAHYEACLRQYGDSHLGVDWFNAQDAETRYRVMLELIRAPAAATVSLLDFGCGASHLLDFMGRQGVRGIDYSGLDLSPAFIALSRQKYPHTPYYCVDILEAETALPDFDYVVMNGVFTEKRTLSFTEMFAYFAAVLQKAFALTRCGLAFNVISAHGDQAWEELFHLPFDRLGAWLTRTLSHNFVIRNDYGLDDYTVYVYR